MYYLPISEEFSRAHRGESRLCFIAKCSKHSCLGPGSYHTNFGDFCAPVQTGTVAQTALVVITAQLASDFVLIADVLKVNCSFLKCAEHNYLFKNLLLHASPLVLCYIYIYTFISSKESYSLKVRLVAMLDWSLHWYSFSFRLLSSFLTSILSAWNVLFFYSHLSLNLLRVSSHSPSLYLLWTVSTCCKSSHRKCYHNVYESKLTSYSKSFEVYRAK